MGTPTDTRVEQVEDGARTRTWRSFAFTEAALRAVLLTGFLVVVAVYFTSRDASFFTTSNALNILSNASVIGIVSLGQVMTIIAGGFDLSVSGTVPLGAVVFAVLVNHGWNVPSAVAGVMVIGGVCGVANGLIVAKAHITPLIATLGTMSVTGGLALTIAGGVQIPFKHADAAVLADQAVQGVDNNIWILLGLSIVLFLVLRYTVYGRYLYAVGGNREAARLGGIPVDTVTMSVYVISAAFAALAGAVLASQLFTGSGTAGTDSALQSIAAVILGGASLTGGVGGVPGTLIGVLILGTLANGMAILSVPAFYQTIATGLVLLLAVGVSQFHLLRRGR